MNRSLAFLPVAAFLVLAVVMWRGLYLDSKELPSMLIDKPMPAFDKLTVERPVWRVNWTVMDSGELHQPTAVRSPDAMEINSSNIEQGLYFRRERQTLRKLPTSGDILFTIRTYSDTFAHVVEEFPDFQKHIGTTIAGSTPQLIDYKGWAKILNELQSWSKS